MTEKLSPAMRQYKLIKDKHPDSILFFQMGDFYEMFYEDASTASRLLDIVLTSRSKKGDGIPMCGVPLSAGKGYANRLAALGESVVICDQVGSAAETRGIVDRTVSHIVTPGMTIDDEGQPPTEPHYMSALYPSPDGKFGLAGLEVSTGDMILGQFDDLESLRAEFTSLAPHECLVPKGAPEEIVSLATEMVPYITYRPAEEMDPNLAYDQFRDLFSIHAVGAWDLEARPEAAAAAAAVISYASFCCQGKMRHLAPPRMLWKESHMVLDEAALANLEILKTLRHGALQGSLLGLMDKTTTPMGSRLLREWLARPLLEAEAITARHGAVEEFLRDGLGRDEIVRLLKKTRDLERALGRLVLNRGTPRDLAVIRDTLSMVPAFRAALTAMSSRRLCSLGEDLPDFSDLVATLQSHLVEVVPLNFKEGGLINRGVSEELDELLDLELGGKSSMAALEAREKAQSGINSLKIGYTRVYGYYLEVTKTNLHLVPDNWIRKQTIAGGERYLTPELKDLEAKILGAGEKRLALEMRILEDLKAKVADQAAFIKAAASILAETDVLAAFAECAERYRWIRPILTDEDVIDIKGGRHPVVEESLPPGDPFVANDICLTPRERLLIITGPNMAGKSTILRQTALIVLLNQAGSFVPAEYAKLSLRDRIFTRVGAADDLTRGRSTFMVEMSETARILSMATPRSLVVLDEIGRGTSTYDGLSLAWAIAEYLHDLDERGVPTLFATHYHELVKLAESKPRVRNFNVAVKSAGRKIIFMRELKAGGASRSYGIAVAGLAGLPKKVLDRAKEVLTDLNDKDEHLIRPAIRQLSLFDQPEPIEEDEEPQLPEVVVSLAEVRPDELTPREALDLLYKLNREARNLIEEDRP
ncbi:DNA mismatch repair protein MutS [Deltaproteobacteria bacterium Smac51]|nr:DNA mismatch repair protein MutS [Deltaproteobacteria bacterium Smac51]